MKHFQLVSKPLIAIYLEILKLKNIFPDLYLDW